MEQPFLPPPVWCYVLCWFLAINKMEQTDRRMDRLEGTSAGVERNWLKNNFWNCCPKKRKQQKQLSNDLTKAEILQSMVKTTEVGQNFQTTAFPTKSLPSPAAAPCSHLQIDQTVLLVFYGLDFHLVCHPPLLTGIDERLLLLLLLHQTLTNDEKLRDAVGSDSKIYLTVNYNLSEM